MWFHHTILIQSRCCISRIANLKIRCLILCKVSPLGLAILRPFSSKARLISGERHLLLLSSTLEERSSSSSSHAKVLISANSYLFHWRILLEILVHLLLGRHGLLLHKLGCWRSRLRAALANLIVVVLLLRELVWSSLRSVVWLLNYRLLYLYLLFLERWLTLSLIEIGVSGSHLVLDLLLLFWRALITIAFISFTISMKQAFKSFD